MKTWLHSAGSFVSNEYAPRVEVEVTVRLRFEGQ